MPPGMPGEGMPPECRLACPRACRWAWLAAAPQCGSTFIPHVYYVNYVSMIIRDGWQVVAFVAGAGFLMIDGAVQFQRRRRRKRTVWVKPRIQVRPVCGAYSSLISDLRNTDECAFRNYSRMNVAAFEDLLSQVEHVIVTQRTRWRAVTICPRDYLLLARDWSVWF